jgi:hypothetical protein
MPCGAMALILKSTLSGYSGDPPSATPTVAATLVTPITEATPPPINLASLSTVIPTPVPLHTTSTVRPPLSGALDDQNASPPPSVGQHKGKRSHSEATGNVQVDRVLKRSKTVAAVVSGESRAGRQSTRLQSKKNAIEAGSVTGSPELGGEEG